MPDFLRACVKPVFVDILDSNFSAIQISRCIVPYIGEGSSCEPVCEEEKILVSLSEAIIPQSSDEKNALQFVRYNHRIYFCPIKYIGFN